MAFRFFLIVGDPDLLRLRLRDLFLLPERLRLLERDPLLLRPETAEPLLWIKKIEQIVS